MQLATEHLAAAAVVVLAFVIGLLVLVARKTRTRTVGRRLLGGPANLRFTCAGCSGQFTHSRRTLGEWGSGARQFRCKACHTKSRGAGAAKTGPLKGVK